MINSSSNLATGVIAMKLSDLAQAIISGDNTLAKELTQRALEEGIPALTIYQESLIPGMDVVGKKMKAGEYYIPEVLLSARAMKQAAEMVKPLLIRDNSTFALGKVVIGTVKGDLHDIGKNLVITMLEGAGFEVTDLGVDVSSDKFVTATKQVGADILGLSALLSITMLNMKEVMDLLGAGGYRREVKVMIGGAPASQKFADEIGADGYAPDAGSAVDLAKKLIAGSG